MEKVALAVPSHKDNYGSILQTYATQRFIQSLGFETRIFDISNLEKSIFWRKIFFYVGRIIYKDERHYLFDQLNSRIKKKMNLGSNGYAKDMRIRHEKYMDFRRSWLTFLPAANSWDVLKEQCNGFNHIVVGSDQLWRPSNIAGGYYTLGFAPETTNKISFATSFGVSELPDQQKGIASNFLRGITKISVREESGKKIVKALTGRDVPVLCDPTMLLDAAEWRKIQDDHPVASGRYILCYYLGDNSLYRDFAKRLKKVTGYHIVGVLHGSNYIASDETFSDEPFSNLGPGEFLNLMRNAEFVCTDSFHGIIFSILHKKKFFCFRRYDDNSEFSTNSRVYNLLEWTGLQNRLLHGNENVEEYLDVPIPYDDVFQRIKVERNKSEDYLRNAFAVGELM